MNKKLMESFFLKNLSEIDIKELLQNKSVVIGLDVGDKTIGVAVSDRRIKIASMITIIARKNITSDCEKLLVSIKSYKPQLIVFGWPLQMNGLPSKQCEKNLDFIQNFYAFLNDNVEDSFKKVAFAKWDERFSTKVVDNLMIEADMSRKRRKEVIDKTAAVYILQGVLDFLNSRN